VKKSVFLIVLAAVVGATSHRAIAADTDDQKLMQEQQEMDKSQATDTQKATSLAAQFNVPEKTVDDLRAKGLGWGEVTIDLAMAQKLSSANPKLYPTMADALNKIASLRASGEGWGKIAKDLGFKLGPVVSAAHHAVRDMHAADHSAPAADQIHPDKIDHPEHPEHPDHIDRPERIDRPGHS